MASNLSALPQQLDGLRKQLDELAFHACRIGDWYSIADQIRDAADRLDKAAQEAAELERWGILWARDVMTDEGLVAPNGDLYDRDGKLVELNRRARRVEVSQ